MTKKKTHDELAPYWAGGLFVGVGTGLATIWLDLGQFWTGYVLDMVGPAWNYILIRGLFTEYAQNAWTRFFTPLRTLSILVLVSFGIETAQYFHMYDATYDPWDFLAYISILVPIFIIDFYHSS